MQPNLVTDFPKNTRAYLGMVSRYDRDEQLKDCYKIVEKLGLPPIVDSIYEHAELPLFINNLRSDEVALIPRLEGLANKKGAGVGILYFMNLMKVQDECLYVVSLDTSKPRVLADLITVQSDAGKDWYALVESVARSVMRGRKLKSKTAKTMARKRHAKPGLVKNWELKVGTPEYITIANIWGNLNIKPAEIAIAMFPDDELREASKATIQRIFDTRENCLQWINELST